MAPGSNPGAAFQGDRLTDATLFEKVLLCPPCVRIAQNGIFDDLALGRLRENFGNPACGKRLFL